MISVNPIKEKPDSHYVKLLNKGSEAGLTRFYKRLYPLTYVWAYKRVRDDVSASSIAQEAFLRLWLLHSKVESTNAVILFLKRQVKSGCDAFYKKSSVKFHSSLIRLDDIGDYQDRIGQYDVEEPYDNENNDARQEQERKKMQQWSEVKNVLPHLGQNQQLFIKLCIRYAFSYDRIAWHLGGISDYEVAQKVEKSIKELKHLIVDTKKLDLVAVPKKLCYEGELNEQQAHILNMRYHLNFSFEEIAAELKLSQSQVQGIFTQALRAIKRAPHIART